MGYNYWKMMDKVGVAIDNTKSEWRGRKQFSGYIFEVGDDKSKESAVEWARSYENRYDQNKETIVHEPKVHEFDNEGFTVTILDSAGGSSQGGRLSFWKCEVEKDGVTFIVGVNDAILADLIRNSDIKNGTVQQKVMFARRGGQPGFIHDGMEAYKEAVADMKKKADLKSAKKTSKWELGGIYSSLTQTDFCLGKVWDHYEEVTETEPGWYSRTTTTLKKREKPVEVYAWAHFYNFHDDKELPTTLEEYLKQELEDKRVYFSTGRPPARAKSGQLELSDNDGELLDKLFKMKEDYVNYHDDRIKGRFTRVK